jgi:hypothetical protein
MLLGRQAASRRESMSMSASRSEKPTRDAEAAEPAPHYHGHRQRLRERFLAAGSDAVRESFSFAPSRCATSSRSPRR